MTQYLIICMGLAGQLYDKVEPPPVGSYLQSYDPEYAGGMGQATWTTDQTKALTFDTPQDAFAAYVSVPKAMPIRADGGPNKPLTAYMVAIDRFIQEQS